MNDYIYVFAVGGKVEWSKDSEERLLTRADNDYDKDLIIYFMKNCKAGSFIKLTTGEIIFCTRTWE